MNRQRAFQQVLEQVDQLNTQIYLKLPAGQASIQQQIKQIETAEQQLKAVKLRLAKVPIGSRRSYFSLIQRIEQALQKAANFKQLAEEFFLDPEGVTSLLTIINQENSHR